MQKKDEICNTQHQPSRTIQENHVAATGTKMTKTKRYRENQKEKNFRGKKTENPTEPGKKKRQEERKEKEKEREKGRKKKRKDPIGEAEAAKKEQAKRENN